ncbi:hypothetical protein INR49_000963, partial [Caranx melampygus]
MRRSRSVQTAVSGGDDCAVSLTLRNDVDPYISDEPKMAEYLASIFGTEKDKHGDRCSRLHNKPTFSQTILIQNIYRNPQNSAQTADASRCAVSDVEMQEHYDEFFE